MAPEAVVTLLREFHERMTAQIFACGGTVEKYIGDAIFAVFGLPTSQPDDAANALSCADRDAGSARRLERRARAATASRRWRSASALNYGPAVLGDVGSEHSLSFTVIGDTVNTASRLQSLTRELKTPLVVADAVVRQISGGHADGAIACRSRCRIAANGTCAAAAAPFAFGRGLAHEQAGRRPLVDDAVDQVLS